MIKTLTGQDSSAQFSSKLKQNSTAQINLCSELNQDKTAQPSFWSKLKRHSIGQLSLLIETRIGHDNSILIFFKAKLIIGSADVISYQWISVSPRRSSKTCNIVYGVESLLELQHGLRIVKIEIFDLKLEPEVKV